MTIAYRPEDLRLNFLLKWRGTIFPLVLSDPFFWILLIVHIGFLQWHHSLDGGLPPLDWKASQVTMGLMTFFLVFYGNNCYSRFYALHDHCLAIGRNIWLWAHLIRSHFGARGAALKWNMMRPMLGAMHLHYAHMRREEGEVGLAEAEWRAMRRANLFTHAEQEVLTAYKGVKAQLAASWALGEVKAALLRERGGPTPEPDGGSPSVVKERATPAVRPSVDAPPRDAAERNRSFDGQLATMPQLAVFAAFDAVARELGASVGATNGMMSQPVPFPYFHMLKLLLLISLLLLSYGMVEILNGQAVISTMVYSVSLLIMIGLEQIAIGMSDPFGDDDVDFDLEGFMAKAYDNALALLVDSRLPYGETFSSEIVNPLTRHHADLRSWGAVGGGLDADDELEVSLARGDVQNVQYHGYFRPDEHGTGGRELFAQALPPSSHRHLPSARRLPPPGPAEVLNGNGGRVKIPTRPRPVLPARLLSPPSYSA